jgi:uncharacterized protein with PQ loop repeat
VNELTLLAGLTSTTLFVVSYLPMLFRALRTRDLASYSRPSLVLANVGNVIQSVYVFSLPAGPIWFLHAFYLGASALMLGLHVRHHPARPPAPPPARPPVDDDHDQAHDHDHERGEAHDSHVG